jgi:hypothetical protein
MIDIFRENYCTINSVVVQICFDGKILLICFVFAIAGIMIASIIYSPAANAKSKSVITSKMCVNGNCVVKTSDSNSN